MNYAAGEGKTKERVGGVLKIRAGGAGYASWWQGYYLLTCHPAFFAPLSFSFPHAIIGKNMAVTLLYSQSHLSRLDYIHDESKYTMFVNIGF